MALVTPDPSHARQRPSVALVRARAFVGRVGRSAGAERLSRLRLARFSALRVLLFPCLEISWLVSLVIVASLSLGGLALAAFGPRAMRVAAGGYKFGEVLEFHQRSAALTYLEGAWVSDPRGAKLAADAGSIDIPLGEAAPRGGLRLDLALELAYPLAAHGVFLDLLVEGRPVHRWEIRQEGWLKLAADIPGERVPKGAAALLTFVLSPNDPALQPPVDSALILPGLRLSAL